MSTAFVLSCLAANSAEWLSFWSSIASILSLLISILFYIAATRQSALSEQRVLAHQKSIAQIQAVTKAVVKRLLLRQINQRFLADQSNANAALEFYFENYDSLRLRVDEDHIVSVSIDKTTLPMDALTHEQKFQAALDLGYLVTVTDAQTHAPLQKNERCLCFVLNGRMRIRREIADESWHFEISGSGNTNVILGSGFDKGYDRIKDW